MANMIMNDLKKRFRAANSPETSSEELKLLSLDNDPLIRASVIHNINRPISSVEILYNDKSSLVQDAIQMQILPPHVQIIKSDEVIGKTIVLRNAEITDAQFIVQLRNDAKKSRFISTTSQDIEAQISWLKKYKESNNQAYFIITDKSGKRYGTVRIYDQKGDSFCWGSWILSDDAPSHFAIESSLIVYKYALKIGFKSAHFSVTKGNDSVIKFHQRFGAKLVSESDDEMFFSISEKEILSSIKRYSRFLPEDIKII